jgi:hypothetical protein
MGVGDADEGEESTSAAVVAGGNAPPIPQSAKHIFGSMALPTKMCIKG